MDALFRESIVLFPQITRRITQILFTKAIEMLRGRKIKLVDYVRKRDIRH